MTLERKLELLNSGAVETGCSKRVLFPPLYRLQLAIGIKCPPPLFQSFARNAWTFGAFFGLFWSGAMWATSWQFYPIPMPIFIVMATMSGVMFGLIVASSLQRTRKRLRLGSWDEFWATYARKQEAEYAVPPSGP